MGDIFELVGRECSVAEGLVLMGSCCLAGRSAGCLC